MKRTSSPISTNLYNNSSDDNSESDNDDYDDERDSSLNPTSMLTCPLCGTTYHRFNHLVRHAKRKHQIDLSNSNQTNSLDLFSSSNIELKDSNEQHDSINSNEQQSKNKIISISKINMMNAFLLR